MNARFILNKLGTLIFIAMILGIVVGLLMGQQAEMFAPIGDLFMALIKMVVIPMVFFSLVGGAASLGNSRSAGKIGSLTFIYYAVTTIIATAIGIIFSVLFKPGAGVSLATISVASTEHLADKGGLPGFWDTLIGFVPINPLHSLVEGNILQIIVFALFVGFAISHLDEAKKTSMLDWFNSMTEIMIKIMTAVMCVAPLGVFGLMAGSVGQYGAAVLMKIIYLVGLYILVLIVVNFGLIGGTVAAFSKCTTYKHFFKSMFKVELFAFNTASSVATLPLNMKTTVEELHVSKETTSFALPLGATINMNGNAAYYAMACVFFAQIYGIQLGFMQYLAIIFTSTVGAVGQAGVPGPTLLVVAVLMSAGIPIEALPILFGVDRIFDMLRTAVNITGDAACATIVDRFRDEDK